MRTSVLEFSRSLIYFAKKPKNSVSNSKIREFCTVSVLVLGLVLEFSDPFCRFSPNTGGFQVRRNTQSKRYICCSRKKSQIHPARFQLWNLQAWFHFHDYLYELEPCGSQMNLLALVLQIFEEVQCLELSIFWDAKSTQKAWFDEKIKVTIENVESFSYFMIKRILFLFISVHDDVEKPTSTIIRWWGEI